MLLLIILGVQISANYTILLAELRNGYVQYMVNQYISSEKKVKNFMYSAIFLLI